jgi:hypothetical protein
MDHSWLPSPENPQVPCQVDLKTAVLEAGGWVFSDRWKTTFTHKKWRKLS